MFHRLQVVYSRFLIKELHLYSFKNKLRYFNTTNIQYSKHQNNMGINSEQVAAPQFSDKILRDVDPLRFFKVAENENYIDFINFPKLNPENTRVMNFLSKDNGIQIDVKSNSLKRLLRIAQVLYAGLTYVTGPSDGHYDEYKGSFSFRFLIKVRKVNAVSTYFYQIMHYRSYLEFNVYELTSQNDPRESEVITQPNDRLFSKQDIYNLSNTFYEYVLKRMEDDAHVPPYFVKTSRSNLLLFGYLEDGYFYDEFENKEEFDTQLKKLHSKISNTE